MRKSLVVPIISVFVMFLTMAILLGNATPSLASESDLPMLSPTDLINGINAYRQQNGLYTMGTNRKLASAAQLQAEYQSSLGYWTHTGSDGSTPMERAYAVGYGDGKKIFATEITYCGGIGTAADAIAWWKTSAVHNSYMLTTQYVEMGAGEATGNANCFTVLMGWITDVSAPAVDTTSTGTANSDTEEYTGQDGTAIEEQLIVPVTKAEPREDGSVYHVVMPGQAMWNIWALYSEDYPDLTIDKLYEMNGLSVWDYLVEGTELLIFDATGGTSSGTGGATTVSTTSENNNEADDVPTATLGPMMSPTPRPTITLMAMAVNTSVFEGDTNSAVTPTPDEGEITKKGDGIFASFGVLHWVLVGVFCLMAFLIVIAFMTEKEEK
jgi:hypothetical protein